MNLESNLPPPQKLQHFADSRPVERTWTSTGTSTTPFTSGSSSRPARVEWIENEGFHH